MHGGGCTEGALMPLETFSKKLQFPPCHATAGVLYYAAFEGHKAWPETDKDKQRQGQRQ